MPRLIAFAIGLEHTSKLVNLLRMKFVWASLATLLIATVLGLGIGLAAHGYGVWLLILSIIGFLAMFIGYGCRSH